MRRSPRCICGRKRNGLIIALMHFHSRVFMAASAGSMGAPLRTGFYVQQSVVDQLCVPLLHVLARVALARLSLPEVAARS